MTEPTLEAALRVKPIGPDVQARLVASYDRFLWSLARRVHATSYGRAYGELDDLHAWAVLFLFDAAERFDHDRPSAKTGQPVKFITYAGRHVFGKLRGLVRITRTYGPLPDAVVAPERPHDDLGEALTLLPAETRAVLVRHYGLDDAGPLSLAETGASLGLTTWKAKRIEREGLERLRELLRA